MTEPDTAATDRDGDKTPGWHAHGAPGRIDYGHDHSQWPNGVSADHMAKGHPDE